MNNNIFLKGFISLIKVIALCAVTYLTLLLFYAQDKTQLGIDIFVLIFISLPTIFIIFFKKDFLAKHTKFVIPWKIYSVFYVIFIILYIGLWIFGNWHVNYLKETQKTIDFINSKRITLDDVMGKNLPPEPDQKINDSTIAGIDANNNYIRDDVELAIFKEYPNSAKIRATELQLAQAIQLQLTKIDSTATFITATQKIFRASDCINNNDMANEIINLEINSVSNRQQQRDNLNNKYMTDKVYQYIVTDSMSSMGKNNQVCDIEPSLLPN